MKFTFAVRYRVSVSLWVCIETSIKYNTYFIRVHELSVCNIHLERKYRMNVEKISDNFFDFYFLVRNGIWFDLVNESISIIRLTLIENQVEIFICGFYFSKSATFLKFIYSRILKLNRMIFVEMVKCTV